MSGQEKSGMSKRSEQYEARHEIDTFLCQCNSRNSHGHQAKQNKSADGINYIGHDYLIRHFKNGPMIGRS